ncbi:MAG: cytochrome c biogenesis CcdA family protein [Gammaproteobacteria bacterium]|nr:cytochrome c biogenesis CcdA family protein [Gammaproteobacteria bacterium]
MELVFGYIAGLLTLINPCVLPVLPIILASAMQAGRHGPLAVAAGMCLSFVTLGMLIATFGHTIGLTDQLMSRIGAVMMMVFGLVLLVPQLNNAFANATTALSSNADSSLAKMPVTSTKTHFIGGLLLGAIWSPCVGPTLGGAISLASQGQNLFWAFLIMLSFGLGISTVIVALGYGTQEAIKRRQKSMRGLAQRAKLIMGVIFLLVGLMIFFKIHHIIEAWLVSVLPNWFQDLSTNF